MIELRYANQSSGMQIRVVKKVRISQHGKHPRQIYIYRFIIHSWWGSKFNEVLKGIIGTFENNFKHINIILGYLSAHNCPAVLSMGYAAKKP